MKDPRISGYATTDGWRTSPLSIERVVDSLLALCSEVVIGDRSEQADTDAWDRLCRIAAGEPRLRLVRRSGAAAHEMLQAARRACRGGYCLESSMFEAIDAAEPGALAALRARVTPLLPVLALPRVSDDAGAVRLHRAQPLSLPRFSQHLPQLGHAAGSRAGRYADLTRGHAVACADTLPFELELLRLHASDERLAAAFAEATAGLPIVRVFDRCA